MASKYLRRLIMRSGLFFFTSREASCATAAYKPKPMQGPYSGNNPTQYAPVKSVRASDRYVLHKSLCLPSSPSATYNSSADDDSSSADDREEKETQLPRSHSCSNLQGCKLPSFKSLLHRASSHTHLLDDRHSQISCKPHEFTAESSSSPTSVSKYTRSWSSPSLHINIGRHLSKLPQKARSFTSGQSKDGRRARNGQSKDGRRRARKGHVAVYVEAGREQHVVPIAYLSHPHFQALLERAKSEFGFRQQGPGLRIPCSLSELHHTLHHIRTVVNEKTCRQGKRRIKHAGLAWDS